MKVGILGCGGIGSRIAQTMAFMGIDMVIADGDKFDESNTKRQVFPADKIGINKAVVLAEMYDGLCNVQAVPIYINEGGMSAFNQCDFTFICPDNNTARKVGIEWALEKDKSIIVSGNETNSANALFWSPTIKRINEKANPFEIYPSLLNGGARKQSCQEAVEKAPQTAHANELASTMSIHLFTYWTSELAAELDDYTLIQTAPVELIATQSNIYRKTAWDFRNEDNS